MTTSDDIRWIKTGIVAGLCASILCPTIIFAPLPLKPVAALAAFLGPAIGIGSIGLHYLVRLRGHSVAAALGAIHNVLAGVLFSAMALVQLAAKQYAPESVPDLLSVWLLLLGALVIVLNLIPAGPGRRLIRPMPAQVDRKAR